jgi:hypothetical protein
MKGIHHRTGVPEWGPNWLLGFWDPPTTGR